MIKDQMTLEGGVIVSVDLEVVALVTVENLGESRHWYASGHRNIRPTPSARKQIRSKIEPGEKMERLESWEERRDSAEKEGRIVTIREKRVVGP
jgi:hypothetical protein